MLIDLDARCVTEGVANSRFHTIEVFECLDSTHTALVARGAPSGVVVVADIQTQGRGRLSRKWVAEPGEALLFSASCAVEQPHLAGFAMAVAVVNALDEFGVHASIKWPNDLVYGDKKVGGILGEVVKSVDGSARVVVGCGINVSGAPNVKGEGGLESGCLGLAIRRDDLLIKILLAFEQVVDSESLIETLRDRCITLNRLVRVELSTMTHEGIAESIADSGELIVDGHSISAGDVIHCT